MPAIVGRKVRMMAGSGVSAVGIIGAQNDSATVANGEVDITDKDDNGYRTLHNDWGLRSIDVTVDGILKDDQLITVATSGTGSVLLADYEVEITGMGTFAGDFWLSNLTIGAPSAEGTTFSATFLSSGEYTFTPAS